MSTGDERVVLDRYLQYAPSDDDTVEIAVRAGEKADKPVDERLFGLFTEHLGKNVYGGAWAQVLANGGFERFDVELADVSPTHKVDLMGVTQTRLQLAADQFKMRYLTRYEELGLAPYWAPVATEGAQYSLEHGFNGTAQAMSAVSGVAGVETPIFLPLHRTEIYDLSMLALLESNSRFRDIRLQVWQVGGEELPAADYRRVAPYGLDNHGPMDGDEPDRLLCDERIALRPHVTPGRWTSVRCVLRVSREGVPAGARLKLRIFVEGSGRVSLDQARLFPADALGGWDPEVVALLREAKISVLRFPGGNFVSGYHWQDGVGPVNQRPQKPNPAWPEWESNDVGTDEWLELCELIGAEPLICVNVGNGTPEEAANWVRYCNDPVSTEWGRLRAANGHPTPYNVRLWEVGNELWGVHQINYADPDEYGRRFAAFSRLMNDADPSIQLIAIGGSQSRVVSTEADIRGSDFVGGTYAGPTVEKCRDQVWAIAEHAVMGRRRLNDADPLEAYLELIAHTHHVRELLDRDRALLTDLGGERILIAQTEQMVAVSGEEQPSDDSLAAAIVWSGFMNWFIRSDGLVPLFTRSALINHGDFLSKVREVVYPLPGYWVQAMYANQPGRIPVPIDITAPVIQTEGRYVHAARLPVIDAVALLDEHEERLTVIAVNRDPRKRLRAEIALHDFKAQPAGEVQILSGPDFTTRNYWNQENQVNRLSRPLVTDGDGCSVTLWPHSIAVMQFVRARA